MPNFSLSVFQKQDIFFKSSSEKCLGNRQNEVGQLRFENLQKVEAKCKKNYGISVKNKQKLEILIRVEIDKTLTKNISFD